MRGFYTYMWAKSCWYEVDPSIPHLIVLEKVIVKILAKKINEYLKKVFVHKNCTLTVLTEIKFHSRNFTKWTESSKESS